MAREIAGAAVLAVAMVLCTISALGVLRSRNNFAALHAVGVANVTLPILALVAVLIVTGFGMSSVSMLVLFAIVTLGGPIVSHALAVAEHRRRAR